MEVGQGPNWGCSAEEKKRKLYTCAYLIKQQAMKTYVGMEV
jgi:hypothetical protein